MPTASVQVERAASSVPFEEFLVARGLLTAAALERAKRLHDEGYERLGTILLRLGMVSERDLAAAFATYAGVPLLAADEYPDAPVLVDRLTKKFLKPSSVLPIAATDAGLVVAVADPLDRAPLDAIQYAVETPVICKVALPSELAKAFDRLYGDGTNRTEQIVARFDGAQGETRAEDAERLKDLASDAPHFAGPSRAPASFT